MSWNKLVTRRTVLVKVKSPLNVFRRLVNRPIPRRSTTYEASVMVTHIGPVAPRLVIVDEGDFITPKLMGTNYQAACFSLVELTPQAPWYEKFRAISAWRFVNQAGGHSYWENSVTGERKAKQVMQSDVPLKREWLAGGSW